MRCFRFIRILDNNSTIFKLTELNLIIFLFKTKKYKREKGEKELSLWNKIKYLNLNIFRSRCCKPLIFQTQIIWSNGIHNLNYLRSATFDSQDIVIRKSEFVAKTEFLWGIHREASYLGNFQFWLFFYLAPSHFHIFIISLNIPPFPYLVCSLKYPHPPPPSLLLSRISSPRTRSIVFS